MIDGLLERERSRMKSITPFTYTGDDLIRDKKVKVISMTLLKEMESVSAKFELYCRELTMFEFSSTGYDIKLVKHIFLKNCVEGMNHLVSLSKKLESIPVSKSESLKFLDILQYLAPGYNPKSFFKGFDANEQKGFFPYDCFTQVLKLSMAQ